MKSNMAYDFSLFEQSAAEKALKQKKKIEKEAKVINLTEEQMMKNQRVKHNPLTIIAYLCLTFIIIAVVTSMITGQVALTETTAKINTLQKQMDEERSIYTQLEMQVESKLSLASIENYAVNTLGMSKIGNSQIEYINLANGDRAEVIEEQEPEWITSIKEVISRFVS